MQWHSTHFRSLRQQSKTRKFLLFIGQKFFPKLVLFTTLTAGFRIDPLGDGSAEGLNYAMFRSWITISASIISSDESDRDFVAAAWRSVSAACNSAAREKSAKAT